MTVLATTMDMFSGFMQSLGYLFLMLAGIGTAYTFMGVALVRRLAREEPKSGTDRPAVTLLKPLHGAEPSLYDNLVSFCDQHYAAPVQILVGVQDADDAAVGDVNRLIRERPNCDIRLIVTPEPRGPNPKIANLIGLQPHIAHDIVIVSDSDIAVGRDYLTRTVAALEAPGVGLVTWLYRAVPQGGIWARLASMAVDYQFLPAVLVGLRLGLARPAFGSTLALRREVLVAIGGFSAFLTRLADDHAIGQAVRARGMRVAIPPGTIAHITSERSLGALVRHELRWVRTIRSIDPRGHAGSVITHPLPLALIGASLQSFGSLGICLVVVALLARLVLARRVDHTFRVESRRGWLLPARDMLSFLIFVASYFVGIVSWRGRHYVVHGDGTLAPLERPAA
jgi:ceramide glucosyltransferase